MTDIELGANIRKIRNLKGLSQENMSESLNMSQKNYSRIETGQLSPTFKIVIQICELLEIELNKLLNFPENIIFNNITYEQQGGEYNAYNNTSIKFVKELYERLLIDKEIIIQQKDQLIQELKKQK